MNYRLLFMPSLAARTLYTSLGSSLHVSHHGHGKGESSSLHMITGEYCTALKRSPFSCTVLYCHARQRVAAQGRSKADRSYGTIVSVRPTTRAP
eukprot:5839281-Prymnesium_polylepis.1